MKAEIMPLTRIIWREGEEKNAPLLQKWAKECYEAELLTVVHKLRDCNTYHISSENFVEEISKLNQMGLVFLPIRKARAVSGFAHKFYEPIPGQPYSIYGVVSHSVEKAQEFVKASQENSVDHTKIGKLLGYPSCCIKFFNKYWVKKREVDPIFSEARRTQGAKFEKGLAPNIKNLPPMVKAKIVTVRALPEVNVALRYFGIRLVPHLPCSFSCQKSKEFSKKFLEFIPSHKEILEFLARPFRWDAYKGVAIIDTDWFQGVVNSMSWRDEYHRIVNFI